MAKGSKLGKLSNAPQRADSERSGMHRGPSLQLIINHHFTDFVLGAARQFKHNLFYYTLNEEENGPADVDEPALFEEIGDWFY